jgi:hypothetical protein
MALGVLLTSCSPPTDRANPYDPRSDVFNANFLPSVISIFPASTETNASLQSAVYAGFNTPVDPDSVNNLTFRILDAEGKEASGSVGCIGKQASFTPRVPLALGGAYTVLLSRAIRSTNGAPMTNDFSWTFRTTRDPTGVFPFVVSTSPADGATNVKRNGTLSISFSEVLDGVTVNEQTVLLNSGDGRSIRGTITCDGAQARFVPDALLDYGMTYSARLTTAIKNAARRTMLSEYRFAFTTEPLLLAMTNWTAAANPANYTAVYLHGMAAFLDKLWIVGGSTGGNGSNVYESSDGANWVLHGSTMSSSAAACLVFNGKLWSFGGSVGSGNDAWVSEDGYTWAITNTTAEFSTRSTCDAVVHNGNVWVVAGDSTCKKDVWYSSTGVNFTRATTDAGFFGRRDHELASFNGAIWVLGGYSTTSGGNLNDVWYSFNGTNWNLATANADWPRRSSHNVVSFGGKLYLMGGADTNSVSYDDVWASVDGTNWVSVVSNAPWGLRSGHRTAVWRNRLWMTGGIIAGGRKSDVWVSD